jgi:hypothetical protein
VKLKGITTHDVITYSEKARRIRVIYPYVRYGLILGGMDTIPGRTLRLGGEFDFTVAVPAELPQPDIEEALGQLFREELQASQLQGAMLSGERKVRKLHRKLEAT